MYHYTLYFSLSKFEIFKFHPRINYLNILYKLGRGPNGPTDQNLQRYEINGLNSLTTLINIR